MAVGSQVAGRTDEGASITQLVKTSEAQARGDDHLCRAWLLAAGFWLKIKRDMKLNSEEYICAVTQQNILQAQGDNTNFIEMWLIAAQCVLL